MLLIFLMNSNSLPIEPKALKKKGRKPRECVLTHYISE